MAIKRSKFGLVNGQLVYRVSIPHVDVDSANPSQLLLDENMLCPQIVQTFYQAWQAAPITLPLIDIGYPPFVVPFADSGTTFPAQYFWGGSGALAQAKAFNYEVSRTSITIYFNPDYNYVAGARFITMRRRTS